VEILSHPGVDTLQSHSPQSHSPTFAATDDCGVTFFRGVLYAVTFGSVFWAVVAAILLLG